MANSSTERVRKLRKKRKLLGYKPYTIWISKEEKEIMKPYILDKLKELRDKEE